MAINYRTLTNTDMPITDGVNPIQGASVTFRLSDIYGKPINVVDTNDDILITSVQKKVYTNANGVFTVELYPNDRSVLLSYYKCVVRNTNGTKIDEFIGFIPDGGTDYPFLEFKNLDAITVTPEHIHTNIDVIDNISISDDDLPLWMGNEWPRQTGADRFEYLVDTPRTFIGSANKFLTVNSTETGIVYSNKPSYTKAEVGLGNVDNTADSVKTVSHANTATTATSANYATTAGSAPASDVYAWAKAATKPSYAETEITFTDVTTGNASATKHGYLPKLANTGTKYLRDDGTWVEGTAGGSGDVVGPASATANAIVRYSGTTGKLIQDSVATLSGTGYLTTYGYLVSGDTNGINYASTLDSAGKRLTIGYGGAVTNFGKVDIYDGKSSILVSVDGATGVLAVGTADFTGGYKLKVNGTSLFTNYMYQIVSSGAAIFVMSRPAGSGLDIAMQTSSSNRWVLRTNTTAETGSNAGSDFAIIRYTDAGAIIDAPLSITRSTGTVAIGGTGTGNLLVGTATDGTSRLLVSKSVTNTDTHKGISVNPTNNATSNGTYSLVGLDIQHSSTTSAGITNSGVSIGTRQEVWRGTGTGSLASIIGNQIKVGSNSTAGTAGSLTTVIGTDIQLGYYTGNSGTDIIGVKITTTATGGTYTNKWGIYQDDTVFNNYFNGKVLIATTDATGIYRLKVNGTSAFLSDVSLVPAAGTNATMLLSSTTDSSIALRTATALNRSIYFQTGTSTRWVIRVNNTSETGSDSGSDFAIHRYDDSSTIKASSLLITRSTGDATFGYKLTVTGAFGCNGATAQTAYASGGALAAYSAGTAGLSSGTDMAALHALVVAMRAALVANGIMS